MHDTYTTLQHAAADVLTDAQALVALLTATTAPKLREVRTALALLGASEAILQHAARANEAACQRAILATPAAR